MPASRLGPRWHHSTSSQGSDQTCVDVAVRDAQVLVRDSKDPAGPVLRFRFLEWQVFLRGVRAGEFELPPGHDAASRDETRA